jgi:hypothetical protein
MRRWFELGELDDTTYASSSGDRQFLQLPQKQDFIDWINPMVNVICRLTDNKGDSTICDGVNGAGGTHPIHNVAPCGLISVGAELRSIALFGLVNKPLVRQYFEKPGKNDGPNDEGKQPTAKRSTQIGNVAAPAVFDAIKVLQAFAAQLLKTRNLELQRIGNIINYELAKAFAGTKTIVAVLQFLQPYLDEANAILNA